MIHIRPIRVSDAAAFLSLCRQLDSETALMMLEPGERSWTVEEQQRDIEALLASPNQIVMVAEDEGRLVGYLGAYGEQYRRSRHSAYLVIGVLQAYAGQGIGRSLFQAIEAWATATGIHRLELTVMTHNVRALHLYLKQGFVVEGLKRHSLLVNGTFVDEYAMAKLLPAAGSPKEDG